MIGLCAGFSTKTNLSKFGNSNPMIRKIPLNASPERLVNTLATLPIYAKSDAFVAFTHEKFHVP